MDIMSWCHHIHHVGMDSHVVHHCGGDHSGAEYTINHCRCGLHVIDREFIRLGVHSINEIPIIVRFTSKCPYEDKWHIESAVKC